MAEQTNVFIRGIRAAVIGGLVGGITGSNVVIFLLAFIPAFLVCIDDTRSRKPELGFDDYFSCFLGALMFVIPGIFAGAITRAIFH